MRGRRVMAGQSASCGSGAAPHFTVAGMRLTGRDAGSELAASGIARGWARFATQARLVRARTNETENGRAPGRASEPGRGGIQAVSRNGGTAKSPAAKWSRIAALLPRRSTVQRPIRR